MPDRMKVRMRGSSTALFPWIWYCPCCPNSPGFGGFPTPGAARVGALEHAQEFHPIVDFDAELRGLLDA